MALPASIQAALETEAREILQRIAAFAGSPQGQALGRQFEERLAHLADRLGQEAFGALQKSIKPTDVAATSPAAAPPAAPKA